MSQLVTCPPASQMGDITVSSCPFDIGQVQKLIFQRKYSTGSTRNVMTVSNAALLATWSALLSASGNTKVQISPFVHGVEVEPGGVIEWGSGNEVVDAIPLAVGTDPTSVTLNLIRISSATKESLVALEGEELVIYMCDEHKRINGETDSNTSPTNFYGIPIYSFHIADRKIGGKVVPDQHVVTFKLPKRWDNKLYTVTPTDFDPLSALAGS
jgi:hypothetical protein